MNSKERSYFVGDTFLFEIYKRLHDNNSSCRQLHLEGTFRSDAKSNSYSQKLHEKYPWNRRKRLHFDNTAYLATGRCWTQYSDKVIIVVFSSSRLIFKNLNKSRREKIII